MCNIMEFLKKIFNDDEKVIGLCSFKKKASKTYSYTPTFSATKLVYGTNTKINFLLT